ncbi:VOC family protein [bacterium]|nr:MAG: VOC family protein [bacterium]
MISAIGHAAFDCYNFESTLDFYNRILGFEEMFRLHNEKDELWIVYLRVNDETYIELFPQQGEAPPKSGSYSHLCLQVNDIEITISQMVQHGVTIDVPIQTGKDGNRQAWIKDPEGNRIEFMQMMPDSLQMRAIERIKATKIAG